MVAAAIQLRRRWLSRLQHLSAHDAVLLLKHSFALPKCIYNLRTSPCFLSPALAEHSAYLLPRTIRMDDSTIRVAVGLRFGAPLCRPHQCHHCGTEVDCLATHGLSCRWSEGRHHRHAAINDIVYRSLTSEKIPACLEPSGLYGSDGKRPDGIFVGPWKNGKLLVWDATCPDTFVNNYHYNYNNNIIPHRKYSSQLSCFPPPSSRQDHWCRQSHY